MRLRRAMLALALLLATPIEAACPVPAGGAEAVRDVLQRTNIFRLGRGRSRVSASAALSEAAQVQACFMARTGTMSHTGAGGSSVGDRVRATGYRWAFVAENVAAGHRTPKAVFRAWRTSAGHRRNMLDRSATDIGIGLASADGTLYWAMVVAKPLR